MLTITSSDAINASTSVEERKELRDEFEAWAAEGYEETQMLFGRDSAFGWPKEAVEVGLRHVHLMPTVDDPALIDWIDKHEAGRAKTSDRILVYVMHDYDPSLVKFIAILDPDGHEKMRDSGIMQSLIEAAHDFRANPTTAITANAAASFLTATSAKK